MNELAKALNEFQSEIVTVGKTASNPFFKSKYAPLEEIMLKAFPVLTKHGLSVMQLPDNINGEPALTTIVMHVSGQSQSATSPLLLVKNDPQGQGSAITYMRRYAYAGALGIVIDEDDDGNAASPTKTAKTGGETLASDAQRKLIGDLLMTKGFYKPEEIKNYLATEYGIKDLLTKADASMVIEDLKGE